MRVGRILLVLGLILLAIVILFGSFYILAMRDTQNPPGTTTLHPLTSAEQTYATTVANQAYLISEAFSSLGSLMAYPLYGDNTWGIQVATELVIIQLVYDEVTAMNPPNSMLNIHNKYVQAMSHYNNMTVLLVQGIDSLNLNLISQATSEMNMGTQIFDEATQLANEFLDAHS